MDSKTYYARLLPEEEQNFFHYMPTINDLVSFAGNHFSDDIALDGVAGPITYRALIDTLSGLRGFLKENGINPGDKVGIQLPNSALAAELILIRHRICDIGVDALRSTAAQGQRLDLRNVAADYRKSDLIHQLRRRLGSQRAGTGSYGVKENDMSEFLCSATGLLHSLDTSLVQRPDIDIESAAD